ncbi:GPI ethanolamine phosphate transferase 2-like protein [Drosera capensis]
MPSPSSPAMPCRRLTLPAVLAVALQITGLSLFVLGFFPVKPTLTGFNGVESYVSPESEERLDVGELEGEEIRGLYRELSRLPASYDRLIFMVIDGLPAEFVLGKDGQLPPAELKDAMPYTQSLLENGVAIGYHAKAAPPTVTMPRLKALMSGAVGGFLDVAFNFNTQALLEDNLLAQFARIGWKMVMLGDDTWLKLFPELFARHDGVSSFFVKDTVFVDRNVSRHLSTELDKDDWQLLILHYLGLDHIGHIGGRKSVLMIHKLGEMDEVIRMIHLNNIANHDDHRGQTLLVVVSDHGMTADGNHGGSSHEETDSLALFIGSSLEAPGYASATHNFANQVDITPTLALLFGVPIPINNIGVVIEESLDQFTDDQKLRALELNSWQLLRLLQAQLSGLPCLSLPSDCCDDHQKSDACNGMVKEKFCCLYSKATASHRAWRSQNMSRSADRDQYNLTISACYGFLTSAKTCWPTCSWYLGDAPIMSHLCFHWLLERQRDSGMRDTILCSTEEVFAVIAVLILALSMGSSSMVEEEQYIWHFITSTFSILLLRRAVKCIPTGREKSLGKVENGRSSTQIFCIFVLLIVARIIRGWHQGGVNWTYLPDISKWLEKAGSSYLKSIQLFSLILLIGWNLLAFSSSTSRRSFTVLVKLSFFCSGLLVLQHLLKYQDDALAASSYGATLVTQIIYTVLAISTFITVLASPWLASVSILAKGSTCYTNRAASLPFEVIVIYFKNDGLNRKPWVEVD